MFPAEISTGPDHIHLRSPAAVHVRSQTQTRMTRKESSVTGMPVRACSRNEITTPSRLACSMTIRLAMLPMTSRLPAKSPAFSAMPEPELSLLFLRPLNRIGGRYIVSGSVASILYGEQLSARKT